MLLLIAAYMIQCSEAFKMAAQDKGSFVFEERGTINVKVSVQLNSYHIHVYAA